jgi:hypothetical protein
MTDPREGKKVEKTTSLAREEGFLGVSLLSSFVFLALGGLLMGRLASPLWLALILIWLLVAVLGSVFAVVRHADHLAIRLGEPYGTLMLTLACISFSSVPTCCLSSKGDREAHHGLRRRGDWHEGAPSVAAAQNHTSRTGQA